MIIKHAKKWHFVRLERILLILPKLEQRCNIVKHRVRKDYIIITYTFILSQKDDQENNLLLLVSAL